MTPPHIQVDAVSGFGPVAVFTNNKVYFTHNLDDDSPIWNEETPTDWLNWWELVIPSELIYRQDLVPIVET